MAALWYVARARRNMEKYAAEAIEELDIATYVPLLIYRNAKGVRRSAPVFRPYLFVNLDLGDPNWKRVRYAKHVEAVISHNQRPVRVPDQDINIIRIAEIAGVYDLTRCQETMADGGDRLLILDVGKVVRVINGPFAGLIGEVRRATPRRRVEILFAMLGTIRIDRANLEPVPQI